MKSIFLAILVSLVLICSCSNKEAFEDPEWFPVITPEHVSDSEIDASGWLDAPAGKHGLVRSVEDKFVFEDGNEIRFWGVNICSRWPYTDQAKVNDWVDYLARYGVNAVRFHKFSSHGLKEEVSTELQDEKYARLDYFHSRLKEQGIYYAWSHIYGHKPKPGDSARLVNYQEVVSTEFPWSHLNGSTASIVNFARDLQDLNIELTTNMLRHRNPITGLSYADDPALIYVELQNEDNIFWGAMEETLKQTPTYRAMLCRQFSDWLEQKYGSQEKLEASWGKENLPQDQSLEEDNIYPQPNHHVFSAEYFSALEEDRPIEQHFLDKAWFLYEAQMDYYNRFTDSIRATGYKGAIVASCWQAGSGITHFYNLLADYNTGVIDRHNYFGGGTGHRLVPGKVNNEAMVNQPGSGLLSVGMQMAEDRPFIFSEWMSLMPNEWTAEAAPIIAVYGMGLQGWDASFAFASNDHKLSDRVQANSHGVYNVESPLHVTLYPALSRMVQRGDIEEAPIVGTRRVTTEDLLKGQLSFEEKVVQDHDRKELSGSFSSDLLAYGKIPVAFGKAASKLNGLQKLPDFQKGDTIASTTNQLKWVYDTEHGYFTINTGGTQGVVGFSGGQEIELRDFSLEVRTPFSVILATSLERTADISSSKRILITTIARARNTGMEYNDDNTELLKVGQAPVQMEPVQVYVRWHDQSNFKISVLDHVGVPTGEQIAISKNAFALDGSQHQSFYYLLERI